MEERRQQADRRSEARGPDRRGGRRARAEAPSKPYCVRLSDEERARMKLAAKVCHQKPADFARDALLGAVEDCLETHS